MVFTFLSLFSLPGKLISQNESATTTQIWFYWHQSYDFTSRIRYLGDLGYRQEFPYENWSKIYFRPGAEWSAGSLTDIAGGVGFWYTVQQIIPNTFELRPWQAVKLQWPSLGRYLFDHYLRLEERFILYDETDHWEFAMRTTYRLNVTFPLNNRGIFDKTLYIRMNAALYADLGKSLLERFIDDRRFSLGLGYRFDPRWRLELFYVFNQSRAFFKEGFKVTSHIIQVRLRTSFLPSS